MKEKHTFELYSALPAQTMKQLAPILEEAAESSYELKIVDITKHPEVLEEKNLLWIPTLIKVKPLPKQTFIHLENIKQGLAAILGVPYRTPPVIKPKLRQEAPVSRGPYARHEEHHATRSVRDVTVGAGAVRNMLMRDVIIAKERARKLER